MSLETTTELVVINGDAVFNSTLSATTLYGILPTSTLYNPSALAGNVLMWSATLAKWAVVPGTDAYGIYTVDKDTDFKNHVVKDSINAYNVRAYFTRDNLTYIPNTINAGYFTTFILNTIGEIYSHGSSNNPSLGYNTTATLKPIMIPSLSAGSWSIVSHGGRFTGKNAFTIAVSSNGRMFSWGDDTFKQLNNGGVMYGTVLPIRTTPGVVEDLRNWRYISCGDTHAAGITQDYRVYTWGNSNDYRTGQNTLGTVTDPGQVFNSGFELAEVVSCGLNFTAILTLSSTVWICGANNKGQRGDGNKLNTPSSTFTQLAQPYTTRQWLTIEAGAEFVVGLDIENKIFTWGDNSKGQLGIGSIMQSSNANPSPLTGSFAAKRWFKVATGAYHVAAIDQDGAIYCWGSNADGQCGITTVSLDTRVHTPTPLDGVFAGMKWKDVSCGFAHTIAVDSEDNMYVWGNDTNTTKLTTPRSLPTTITPINTYLKNYNAEKLTKVKTGQYILRTPIGVLPNNSNNITVSFPASADIGIESTARILNSREISLTFNDTLYYSSPQPKDPQAGLILVLNK